MQGGAKEEPVSRCKGDRCIAGLPGGRVRTLLREGRRFRGQVLTLVCRAGADDNIRVGVAIASRWGTAVRRNRLRRVVKEYLRQHLAPGLPPMEILIQCRRSVDRSWEQEAISDLRALLGPGGRARKVYGKENSDRVDSMV
jgi:ribonuclease P protein component